MATGTVRRRSSANSASCSAPHRQPPTPTRHSWWRYFLQFQQGQSDFGAYEVNAALKNLGEGVGNITTAFDTLKARKPADVIQLKKSGTSKQARKTYKVTLHGKTAVEAC